MIGLPKTRSGTFGMRRILRKVAGNELGSLGDTSTLLDPAVVEEIVVGGCERDLVCQDRPPEWNQQKNQDRNTHIVFNH